MGSDGTVGRTRTWEEDLASLVEDSGIRYNAVTEEKVEHLGMERSGLGFSHGDMGRGEIGGEESLRDQVRGFITATGELMQELGRSCWDIVEQSLEGVEDSYIFRRLRGPVSVAKTKLEFLNDFLPEDRDPIHAWPIVIFVFLFALSGIILIISYSHAMCVLLIWVEFHVYSELLIMFNYW